MSNRNISLFIVNCLLFGATLFTYQNKINKKPVVHQNAPRYTQIKIPVEPVKPPEQKPQITTIIPQGTLSYDQIVAQLKKWNQEAPEITEYGVYGKTQNGTDISYLRIGKKTGPKVLIMAAIHGNEKLCTMTAMGVMGKMLDNYMKDEEVTKLIRERDIYYVPVVSPEGYKNNSRHDMGKDPNRNFNGPNLEEKDSIASIKALKEFHLKEKFNAMMSNHNMGKIYFYGWGYTHKPTEQDAAYKEILGKMSKASGYNYKQILRDSAPPYYGYEIDWFHQHGAMAVVNEIGTRFEANQSEVNREVELNYKAFLIWIKEAPVIRPPPQVMFDASLPVSHIPYYEESTRPGWEERGEEFRKWLAPSVRVGKSGSSGSGTIFYYDSSTNEAYVISCGHLFNRGYKSAEAYKQKPDSATIDVFYHNEKKLDSPKSYKAQVLCHVWGNSDSDIFDVSLMKFTPDWKEPWILPIAPKDLKLVPGKYYHSLGCDGGGEVAHYSVKYLSERPSGTVTELVMSNENGPRGGRSGGGVFTDDGYLICICSRGDSNSSLWTSLNQIHKLLTQEKFVDQLEGITMANKIPVVDRNGPQGKYPRGYLPSPKGF
jgi:hypothetical protein